MSTLLEARSHSRMLASKLYGGKVGTAFLAHAGNAILLETAQAVYEDICRLADPEDYDNTWSKYSGLLSNSKSQQRQALNDFIKDRVVSVDHDFWRRCHEDRDDNLGSAGKPVFGLDLEVKTVDDDFGAGSLSRCGKQEDLRWSYNWPHVA